MMLTKLMVFRRLLLIIFVVYTFVLETNSTNSESSSKLKCDSCISNDTVIDKEIVRYRQNCRCDPKCNIYGDCCGEFKSYNGTAQKDGISSFSCVYGVPYSVYMKHRCPLQHQSNDTENRTKCERNDDASSIVDENDIYLHIPVTSNVSHTITYRNVYCARCNGDADNLQYWEVIMCAKHPQQYLATKEEFGKIRYDRERKSWLVDGTDCRCDEIVPKMPKSLRVEDRVRRCIDGLIDKCTITNSSSDYYKATADNCSQYTSVIYTKNDRVAYRNVDCAKCNNASLEELECKYSTFEQAMGTVDMQLPRSFDFKYCDRKAGKRRLCWKNQIYDPFFNKCRSVYHSNDTDGYNDLISYEIVSCPKYRLNRSEYKLYGDFLYVKEYEFNSTNYINENQSAMICIRTLIFLKLDSQCQPYFGILTSISVAISILCLSAHLLIFLLATKYPKSNLSEMNLASYCFALLTAYCCFVSSDYFGEQGKTCFLISALTYYFFLASLFWLTTIAFDVRRTTITTKSATGESVVKKRALKITFVIYSCCSWLVPAAITLVVILIDTSPEGYSPSWLRPNFNVVSCWFESGEDLLLFLGSPFAFATIFWSTFYVDSAFKIYRIPTTSNSAGCGKALKNYNLFWRLTFIAALAWMTGVTGARLNDEFIWSLFALFNAVHGLFIFIAFTCTKRTLNSFNKLFYRHLHAPTSPAGTQLRHSAGR